MVRSAPKHSGDDARGLSSRAAKTGRIVLRSGGRGDTTMADPNATQLR